MSVGAVLTSAIERAPLLVVLARAVTPIASLLAPAGLRFQFSRVRYQLLGSCAEGLWLFYFDLGSFIPYLQHVFFNVSALDTWFCMAFAILVAQIAGTKTTTILLQTRVLALARAATADELLRFVGDLSHLHLLLDEFVLLQSLLSPPSEFAPEFQLSFPAIISHGVISKAAN